MGTLFFSARDDDGYGLFRSDGTDGGTSVVRRYPNEFFIERVNVASIFPTDGGAFVLELNNEQSPLTEFFTESGKRLFSNHFGDQYLASDGNYLYYQSGDIYRTDSVKGSSEKILDLHGNGAASNFTFEKYNGKTQIVYTDFAAKVQHITSLDDGGKSTDIKIPYFDAPIDSGFMVQLGKNIIFANFTYQYNRELWVSDGTTGGTKMLKDIFKGTGRGIENGDNAHAFQIIGDKAVFAANDGKHGSEIWVTDGTAAGTMMLADTWLGTKDGVGTFLRDMPTIDDQLFFVQRAQVLHDDSFYGAHKLWTTDGTKAGTKQINLAVAGEPIHVGINGLVSSIGTKVVFEGARDDDPSQTALYGYDTATGKTALIKNISKIDGNFGDGISEYTKIAGRLYFVASDGGDNYEIWFTDGTTKGTQKLTELRSGQEGSLGTLLTVVGDARTSQFNDVISLSNDNREVHAEAGNDKIYGTASADTVFGDAGSDTLFGSAGADKLNGGTERDTVSYAKAKVGVVADLNTTSVNTGDAKGDIYSSIENLTGSAFADKLYGHTGNNILAGGAGNDTLRGDDGDDALYGDVGNDILFGDAGNDKIYAGLGSDKMAGGSGQDIFVFNTALSVTTNVDSISDFKTANDTIYIDDAVFKSIAKTGELLSGYFRSNDTGLAQDANDHIIYEKDTGELYYDSNGTAAGGSVLFATVKAGLSLTYADFFVI